MSEPSLRTAKTSWNRGAAIDTEQRWLRPGHRVDTRSVVIPTGPAALRQGGTVYDLRVCQDEAARRHHQSGGGMRTVVRWSDPVTPSGRAERARARTAASRAEGEALVAAGAAKAEATAALKAATRAMGFPAADVVRGLREAAQPQQPPAHESAPHDPRP